MIIPDDANIAFKNCLGLLGVFFTFYSLAFILQLFLATIMEIIMASIIVSLLSMVVINRFTKSFSDNLHYQLWSRRAAITSIILLAVAMLIQLIYSTTTPSTTATSTAAIAPTSNLPQCYEALTHGHWSKEECTKKNNLPAAFCETNSWTWDTLVPGCSGINQISTSKARDIFRGKKIAFFGDSEIRSIYHQFVSILDPTYIPDLSVSKKHGNFQYAPSFDRNSSYTFYWTPQIEQINEEFKTKVNDFDLIVTGVGLWDALYLKNTNTFNTSLNRFSNLLSQRKKSTTIWIQPPTILNDRLQTKEKQEFMSEEKVQEYRSTFETSSAAKQFDIIMNPRDVSKGREDTSIDGIHYSEQVYEVLAQMVVNAFSLKNPTKLSKSSSTKSYKPKKTGPMSSPFYGMVVLVISAIMLFTMDNFFGVGFLSLILFGRNYDWESAYRPLLNKILGDSSKQQSQIAMVSVVKKNQHEQDDDEVDPLIQAEDRKGRDNV